MYLINQNLLCRFLVRSRRLWKQVCGSVTALFTPVLWTDSTTTLEERLSPLPTWTGELLLQLKGSRFSQWRGLKVNPGTAAVPCFSTRGGNKLGVVRQQYSSEGWAVLCEGVHPGKAEYLMAVFLLAEELLECFCTDCWCGSVEAECSVFCFRTMYLLGYIPKDNRLYLGDKELNIVSYSLLVSVLEYQTAVMRRDFGMADKVLPTIPKEQRTRVAHFLEKQARKLLLSFSSK